MKHFTVFSLITVAAATFGIAIAGPISLLEERSSGLSCGPIVDRNITDLGFGIYYDEKIPHLGKKLSPGGQWQVVALTDGAEPLSVSMRYCNSSHLGIFENTNHAAFMHDIGYVSYGKFYLTEDESKCLQRHATLPSSNPTQKTHIAIEDCSNEDGPIQARQFWSIQTKYDQASPIIKENGKISDLPLVLSDTHPQAVLATRSNPDSQFNKIVL